MGKTIFWLNLLRQDCSVVELKLESNYQFPLSVSDVCGVIIHPEFEHASVEAVVHDALSNTRHVFLGTLQIRDDDEEVYKLLSAGWRKVVNAATSFPEDSLAVDAIDFAAADIRVVSSSYLVQKTNMIRAYELLYEIINQHVDSVEIEPATAVIKQNQAMAREIAAVLGLEVE